MNIPTNPSGSGESQPTEFQPGIDDAVFFPSQETAPTNHNLSDPPKYVPTQDANSNPAEPIRNNDSLQSPGKQPSAPLAPSTNDASDRNTASAALPLGVFAVVAAIALMPKFLTHLGHLSHMPHRSHFAIVLLAFGALVWKRWRHATAEPQIALRIPDLLILAGSCCLFGLGAQLGSPWLAAASLILLGGVFLRRLPSIENIGYSGPWAFLLLLLPLPLGFDQTLIQSLQAFATGCSSRLLDLMSVNHMVSGNVLELPTKQLFIDEACSGIQSLFAMLTCVAFFAAWTRRPPILAVPLLAASVVMCTITNIFRIILVVQGELRGVDLATGWAHECLGAALFGVALMLIYCSEGFFLFVFAPIINPATGTPDNRTARFWNNLTRSIHGAVYGVLGSDKNQVNERSWLDRIQLPQTVIRGTIVAATVCFAFFGISQHIHGSDPQTGQSVSKAEALMLARSEALQESSLPDRMGPWKRKSFERIDRTKGLITDSVTWVYRSPYYEATISLDYPFFGSHNVTDCYHLTGWDVREQTTTELGYSKATLNRPFGEVALLFYDVFDVGGTVELESPGGKFSERLRDFDNSGMRPTWQLQLIIRSDFGLSKSDLEEIELAFREIRAELRSLVSDGKSATFVGEMK